MKDLPQASIGTAPLWLMRGRKAQEQVVILYVWEAELMRAKWSFASIQRSAGISSASVVCKALCDDGLLKTQDAPHRGPYTINLGWLPVHVSEPTPEPAKPKRETPPWAISLMLTWKEQTNGYIQPSVVEKHLSEAVEEHGLDDIRAALCEYIQRIKEARFRSIKNFAEHLGEYLEFVHMPAVPGNQSLASLG